MNYKPLWRDLHFPSTPTCLKTGGTAGGFTVSERLIIHFTHTFSILVLMEASLQQGSKGNSVPVSFL